MRVFTAECDCRAVAEEQAADWLLAAEAEVRLPRDPAPTGSKQWLLPVCDFRAAQRCGGGWK